MRALRAERHPDADFVPAAGHRVRDNAVNAKAGHQQRGSGKGRHEGQLESALGDRAIDHLLHGADGLDRQLRILAAKRGAKAARDAARVASCPNHQGHAIGHALPVGIVGRRRRVAVEHGAHLGNDSDQRLELVVFTHETPAHGFGFSGPEELCRLLREDSDALPAIAFLERPAVRTPMFIARKYPGLAYRLLTGWRCRAARLRGKSGRSRFGRAWAAR